MYVKGNLRGSWRAQRPQRPCRLKRIVVRTDCSPSNVLSLRFDQTVACRTGGFAGPLIRLFCSRLINLFPSSPIFPVRHSGRNTGDNCQYWKTCAVRVWKINVTAPLPIHDVTDIGLLSYFGKSGFCIACLFWKELSIDGFRANLDDSLCFALCPNA